MHLQIPYSIIRREDYDETMLSLEQAAIEAAKTAYAPYSHFQVGAAALLLDGTIVKGSNQENAAYPSGLCAERTALFQAGALYPDQPVVKLFLAAFAPDGSRVNGIAPCGACRQVLMETSTRYNHPFEVILSSESEATVIPDNRLLLPFGFDSAQLQGDSPIIC